MANYPAFLGNLTPRYLRQHSALPYWEREREGKSGGGEGVIDSAAVGGDERMGEWLSMIMG